MIITEIAKFIREDLKRELGVNSRQVSVTTRRLGFDQEISVRIRVSDVSFDAVNTIAKKYEKVRTDCLGEHLNGGNCYVDVYRFVN